MPRIHHPVYKPMELIKYLALFLVVYPSYGGHQVATIRPRAHRLEVDYVICSNWKQTVETAAITTWTKWAKSP
eukprot:4223120-Amphidinium_carterae.1